MARMPVMQAVVAVLESEGIEVAFGIPGAAILPLYDALQHSRIRHLTVRHEEGATHAADGYARASGKVGLAIGTSGPAGTNMITGLYTALADSIPIICITGQAPLAVLHKESFQAVDIVEIARPVTKWAVQVKEAAQMPWIFRKAFQVARSGRPGPILIDLPLDVQRQLIEFDPELDEPLAIEVASPSPRRIARALEMLTAAHRPIIIAGGGVISSGASDELVRLAEALQIPVSPTLMGKGSIREDHQLYAGIVGIQTQHRFANALFLESDCVLAVGARFGDRHTGSLDVYRGERKFIHIDVEPTQIGKVFDPDLGIVADARLALQALATLGASARPRPDNGSWVARLAELKSKLGRRQDFADVPIRAARVYKEANETLPDDAIVVTAIGLYQIWSGQHQLTYRPRHYLVCGQAGPLGWEVSACTGAKLAKPDQLVVGMVGDYSFQFMMEEVAVAAQYRVPFVLIMLNNGNLGLIRQAEIPYDMVYAIDLAFDAGLGDEVGIDHCKLMEAMGCLARRVSHPDEIRSAIEWAIHESNSKHMPVLVEVMIDRWANAAMGSSIAAVKEFDPLPVEVIHAVAGR
jgi:tartronate-semialdehyde synthase